jgi:hypothetical protein
VLDYHFYFNKIFAVFKKKKTLFYPKTMFIKSNHIEMQNKFLPKLNELPEK